MECGVLNGVQMWTFRLAWPSWITSGGRGRDLYQSQSTNLLRNDISILLWQLEFLILNLTLQLLCQTTVLLLGTIACQDRRKHTARGYRDAIEVILQDIWSDNEVDSTFDEALPSIGIEDTDAICIQHQI